MYSKNVFSIWKACHFSKILDLKSMRGFQTRNKASVTDLKEATRSQVKTFLKSFDTVLADCDGVLWLYDDALPDSAAMMNYFRIIGKKIFFVTNNSTKSRNDIAKHALKLGFIASQEDILSTAYLAAHYLNGIDFKRKVYLLGSKGMAEELKAAGIRYTGFGPDVVKGDYKNLKSSELDSEVEAVVVGFDFHISYPKLIKAASYLARDGCLFIATNTENRSPKRGPFIMPGTGTLLRAVECSTGRKALILGKPHDYIKKYLEACGLNPARTLVIGDNCDTDIELGVRCGFQTLLVLSGVTTLEYFEKICIENKPPLPNFVLPKLGDILSLVPV